MEPVTLTTQRLVLEPPVVDDIDTIVELCQDPLFERFLTIPWPYRREHAEFFLDRIVAPGWEQGAELAWALRPAPGGRLLGVIGWRAQRSDLGFWLGAPHRGNGYMTEAAGAVIDWLFASLPVDRIAWECIVGNAASVSVARKLGFAYTGERPADVVARDGTRPPAWHAVLHRGDGRRRTLDWPA